MSRGENVRSLEALRSEAEDVVDEEEALLDGGFAGYVWFERVRSSRAVNVEEERNKVVTNKSSSHPS